MSLDRTSALRESAGKAAIDLEGASAQEILAWADERLGDRLVVATSLQDALVIDLVSRVRSGVDVIFLDTGYHFAETIGMRAAVKAAYDVRLISVEPGQTVAEQDAAHGPDLFAHNPDLCCHLRKVVPLSTMLAMYDGWVTGVRRSETADRGDAAPVEWDEQREMIKINPIVGWSDDEVDTYVELHQVLVNPLRSEGYPSIGCAPCTAKVTTGADPRSGRWAGSNKMECGLHL
jgi:phosphoadenosine phosphosulfate reductase